ncbi:hypothetical protein [Nocardia sp. NPDC048505]|uniref:hypothetical protein n=1 Tax=unclassified Nocardia TaxID=2637762 RepID=UPI0033C90964
MAAEIRAGADGQGIGLPVRVPSTFATFAVGAGSVSLAVCGIAVNVLLFAPALVLLAFFASWYRRRKSAAGTVVLVTPRHLTIESRKESAVFAWQDISRIEATSGGKGGSRVNYITLVGVPVEGGNRISHEELATDFTRVYYLLEFYLRHPVLRAELGTERSLERFRRGDYLSASVA